MDQLFLNMPGLETEGSKLAVQKAMHSQYVLQFLQLQRRAGFLCDITVNIQEKSFKAHKPLLAACSLYFRALFADSENAKTSTLNFEKLTASGFEVLLDYIYSGSLAITSENSNQVLHAANCLQMINVVETCLNFIRSSFKATTGDPAGTAVPRLNEGAQPEAIEIPRNPPLPMRAPVQPNVLEPTPTSQLELANHRTVHGAVQIPKVVPEHLNWSSIYHQATPYAVFQSSVQNHVPKIHIPTAQSINPDQPPSLSQHPRFRPSQENVLMSYHTAPNCQRPTLNVGQYPMAGIPQEMDERLMNVMKQQIPPTLIPTSEVPSRKRDPNLYVPSDELNVQHNQAQSWTSVSSESQTAPQNMPVLHSTLSSLACSSADNETANRATVDPAERFHPNKALLTSKAMQPFVLLTTQNNALDLMKRPELAVDSSKGGTWSDDRSVKSKRLATHLSGTPCSADLTRNISSVATATSPSPFGSAPSVGTFPESQKTPESQAGSRVVPKVRLGHTHSLELPTPSPSGEYETDGDFRSTSLSPRFFSERNSVGRRQPATRIRSSSSIDQLSQLSARQMPNVVGALFHGTGTGEKRRSTSSVATQSSVDEDSRLIIEEPPDRSMEREAFGPEKGRMKAEQGVLYSAEFDSGSLCSSSAETEESYIGNTATPTNNSRFTEFNSPSETVTGGHDATVDENEILDLSMQKLSSGTQHVGTSSIQTLPRVTRPKEVSITTVPSQPHVNNCTTSAANVTADDTTSVMPVEYSRKPRRSSGPQICNWPGCGRLFRHRNMFEEHVKQHKRGVPVKQLKRCYMGARVKKTARERLDEMRMTDGAAASSQAQDNSEPAAGIASVQAPQGARKRPGAAYSKKGTDRKRVSTRDRKDHSITHGLLWPQPCPTLSTVHRVPVYSHPPGTAFYSHAPGTPLYSPAPSTPLAVLQAVTSQHPAVNEPVGTVNLLNNAAAMALSAATEARSQLPRHVVQPAANKSAVVETLAALGIPIPNHRNDTNHVPLAGVPPLLSSMEALKHQGRAPSSLERIWGLSGVPE